MDETSVRGRMQSTVDLTLKELAAVRTGRATSAMVEDLSVPVYGGAQRLTIKELGSITVPDSQTIVIEPWDKSIIGEIRKGILEANVGLNPAINENLLRISFPSMTTEDREKYVKLLGSHLEKGKVMVRQVRTEAMHEVRKAFETKEVTEDEKFRLEKRIQELTDEYIGKIEVAGEAKKQELLNI